MTPSTQPGRACPLHYHYRPDVFRQPEPPHLANLDVLYVVGGLYGKSLALEQVLRMFETEQGRKQLVFNGDFHWFDVDASTFERIQREVLRHVALRGNVETELAQATPVSDAGCGCAYPDWVFNNGAAGMPNFQNDPAGLLTRIALTAPLTNQVSRASVVQGSVHIDALTIDVSAPDVQQRFLAQWPPGSDAHASYFSRIAAGPSYPPHQVVRQEV